MYRTKLCMVAYTGRDIREQILLYKNTGFDGFFLNWSPKMPLREISSFAKEQGMFFQSIHAPFLKSADMWTEGEKALEAVNELLACLKDCAACEVPLMVVHAFIGFEDHAPNEHGIRNFGIVVEEAARLNVKIAFENTEGEEYLAALMEAFKDYPHVGFCWDTGHEMCYNHSKDMLALYGDRLLGTHINDNLGIKDYEGNITYLDDLHLLPFDGIGDWDGIAERLNRCGFEGPLTFELNRDSKPGRHENDIYGTMPFENYIAEVYKRACRVAALR